jgi:hypothetical protein
MIKKLSYIFGSQTHAQEIVLLLHDAKEVVRQGFYAHEFPKVEKFCQEHGVHVVKSKFKVILADKGIYSNKGIRIPEKDKRDGMYFVYFSKNEEKAWLAAYYELMENTKDLGLVLGYPECCVDFFCNSFTENNTNLQHAPTNPWTNLSKREEDAVLLSHFPCSSDCEESIQLARIYFKVIGELDRGWVQVLRQKLTV